MAIRLNNYLLILLFTLLSICNLSITINYENIDNDNKHGFKYEHKYYYLQNLHNSNFKFNSDLFDNPAQNERFSLRKQQLNFPTLDDNVIETIIDDHQRQISLLLQHPSFKPFLAFKLYGQFVFFCDEQRIYITSIKSNYYNQLSLYNEFKILYEIESENINLVDLTIDYHSQRLFFLMDNGKIGLFHLCPRIELAGYIRPNINFNHINYSTYKFLFYDNVNNKLLLGDDNQVLWFTLDGDNVEIIHKFGFIEPSQKFDLIRSFDMNENYLYWNDKHNLYRLSYTNGKMIRLLEDARLITNKIRVIDHGKFVYFLTMGKILNRIDLSENKYPKFDRLIDLINTNYTITSFDIINNDNEKWCPIDGHNLKHSDDNNHYHCNDKKSFWDHVIDFFSGNESTRNYVVTIITLSVFIIIVLFTTLIAYCVKRVIKSKSQSKSAIDDNDDHDDNITKSKKEDNDKKQIKNQSMKHQHAKHHQKQKQSTMSKQNFIVPNDNNNNLDDDNDNDNNNHNNNYHYYAHEQNSNNNDFDDHHQDDYVDVDVKKLSGNGSTLSLSSATIQLPNPNNNSNNNKMANYTFNKRNPNANNRESSSIISNINSAKVQYHSNASNQHHPNGHNQYLP